MKLIFIGTNDETATLAQMFVRIRWSDATSLVAATAQEGIDSIGEFYPDFVLINPPFPDMSISLAIEGIRRCSHVPLMVLGQNHPMALVTALEMGADGYVSVPFDVSELMARIGAQLRRNVENVEYELEKPVRSGTMFINPATFELFLGDQLVPVTSTELKLLHTLMKNHGSVVTHEVLEPASPIPTPMRANSSCV